MDFLILSPHQMELLLNKWYPEGSILLVTLHNIPNNASQMIGETPIKSICLAQVKWLKIRSD